MDLLLSLVANDSASAVFGNFKGAVIGASRAVTDMMKSAADAERVERQLKSVAGELTGAFKQQAQAMSEQLAVEDELIMSMQTLQLRYGAAPAQIDEATRAVLDYAAATGKDAVSATEALLKGVQQGTGSIKALGVQYEVTGDFTKDLANATAALAKKFGGAAATDAESISGTARAAEIAMGELSESFGGLMNDFIVKSGAVEEVTRLLRQLKTELFGAEKDQWDKRGDLLKEKTLIEGALAAGIDSSVPGSKTQEQVVARLKEINAELAKIDASPAAAGVGLSTAPLAGHTGTVKGKKGGGGGSSAADEPEFVDHRRDLFREQMKQEEEFELEQELRAEKAREKELKEQNDFYDEMFEAGDKALKKQIETEDKMLEQAINSQRQVRDNFDREQQKSFAKQTDMWADFGLQAGQQLMQGIIASLSSGGDGKGPDVGMIAADTALNIIGSVFSMFGYGGMFGALTGAMDSSQTSKTNFHTGGWPRAHTGMWMPGEVPALLQEGERVWSRSEVAAAGGRAAVDALARGGMGRAGNVYVSALDSQSVMELFGGKGGRGFYNMLRSGRGPLPAVLGRT